MKKAMLVLAIGLIGSSLLVGCGGDKQGTSSTQNNTQTTQTEQSKENNTPEYKEMYKAGFYEVGKDLPAGEYLIIRDKLTKDVKTSVIVTKDSEKEDEIFDESVMGNVYVTLENGQYIEVKNGNIYPVDKAPSNTPEDKVYKDGMYKVGKDIEAGTYDVKALTDDASIEISKDSTHSDKSIITKKEFKNTEKITLKDGEYIILDDAEITVK